MPNVPAAVRRSLLWTLLALPLVFAVARWMEFRTHFEVNVSPEAVELRLGEAKLKGPFAAGALKRVSVETIEPFMPLHGGSIVVTGADGVAHRLELPPRWTFPAPKFLPVGDWFADEQWASQPVASWEVAAPAPFRAEVEIPGRVLRAVVVHFETEQRSFDCRLRFGLMDNDLVLISKGEGDQGWGAAVGGPLTADARHLAAPLARGLCLGLLLVLGFGALRLAAGGAPPVPGAPFRWGRWLTFAAVALALGRLALSGWVARELFDGLPHFQDDFCYFLRARWLLDGTLDRPVPPLSEHFAMPFTVFKADRWLTFFPLNWSLLLAVGELAGAAWLVAPVCGALSVWFLYRFGARAAGPGTGLLAALVLAVSPLAVTLSGSLMNHTATGMLLGLCLLLWTRGWDEGGVRLGSLLGAGAALGFAFGIRPLTAALAGAPTFLLGLAEWRRHGWGRRGLAGMATFAGGVALGALPALLDNAVVTGHWWTFAYSYLSPASPPGEALAVGTAWSDRVMAQLPIQMSGWGWPWLRGEWWLCLPFGFAAVPFLRGRATRHDWWCLGLFLALVVGHLRHPYNTAHGFGARLYSDALFAIAFLVARGAQELAHLAPPGPLGVGRALAPGAVALLCGLTAWKLPARMERFRAYNAVAANAERLLDQKGLRRALVLLRPDPMLKWLRLARRLPLDPTRADLVFAEMRDDNAALLERFGDRPVWILEDRDLVPYVPPSSPP